MIRSLIKKTAMMIFVVGCPVVMLSSASHGAAIYDSYPGHPNAWDGLTTNSIIKLDLDESVAMIGGQPDMVYHVKAATFSGFEMILTDVACDVEVSGDLKTIRLYPQNIMDNSALFAYKIENINFAGGGSSQTESRFYTSGVNPAPLFNTTIVEGDMCNDTEGKYNWFRLDNGMYCGRCHPTLWEPYMDCTITP